jgi:hypothetical protein
MLYQKKRFPRSMTKTIKFISNFETSRKITLLVICFLLAVFVGFSIQKVFSPESDGFDYISTYQGAQQFNSTTTIKGLTEGGPTVHYALIAASLKILGNIRIVPFIESIALLVLTYFITKEITQKRFAGIVSMVIVLQSSLFLKYDTDYAYTNAWTLFFILSLYLIQKRQWYISIVSYILSILSKELTALFLPVTFFFIYSANIPRKTKIVNAIGFSVLVAFTVVYLTRSHYGITGVNTNMFWIGFTALENFLHSDGLILIFLLSLAVGLFIMSRRGIAHANSMMVLISGALWSTPLLVSLTDFTNQPYRLMPLIVFFGMGVGILLSKKKSMMRSNYSPY